MRKIVQIIVLLSLGLFMNSCYYDEYPDWIVEDETETPPEGEDVSFATYIQPILNKCTNCHKGGFPSPDLRSENAYSELVPTYVTAGNADGSRLYNYLPGNGHHDVGFVLNSTEIQLVKDWINQGAKNN